MLIGIRRINMSKPMTCDSCNTLRTDVMLLDHLGVDVMGICNPCWGRQLFLTYFDEDEFDY